MASAAAASSSSSSSCYVLSIATRLTPPPLPADQGTKPAASSSPAAAACVQHQWLASGSHFNGQPQDASMFGEGQDDERGGFWTMLAPPSSLGIEAGSSSSSGGGGPRLVLADPPEAHTRYGRTHARTAMTP